MSDFESFDKIIVKERVSDPDTGEKFEIEFQCRYYPGDPGRSYGPPEHCYAESPAMAEINVIALHEFGRVYHLTLDDVEEADIDLDAIELRAEEMAEAMIADADDEDVGDYENVYDDHESFSIED